jgi:hypothetical protein
MIAQTEPYKSIATAKAGAFSNLAYFQAGWIACVLGASAGHTWTGISLSLLITAAHIVQAERPSRELALAAMGAALGLLANSALIASGQLGFADDSPIAWLAPAWTIALGMLLATTLNIALRPMHDHPWRAALLGAIGAPLAYLAGSGLGAFSLPYPEIGLGIIGLGGMSMLPLLLAMARRWDGMSRLEA